MFLRNRRSETFTHKRSNKILSILPTPLYGLKAHIEVKMRKTILILISLGLIGLSACQPEPSPMPMTEEPFGHETEPPGVEEIEEYPDISTEEISEEAAEPSLETSLAFEPTIALEQIITGLTAPVDLDAPNDGSGRMFVTDQIGVIRVIDHDGNLIKTPLLDLQDRLVNLNENYDERGLLGLALHPDFSSNGRLFVYYSAPLRAEGPSGWNHTSILSEFTVSPTDDNAADPDSERIIMEIDQPQANHNAGAIAFGPDGLLYIPLGDGGGAHDTGTGHGEDWYETNQGGNGQDVEQNMLGSVLRIDIDQGDPYAVPDDNPGISTTFPEIWAYGFRNPYRMAFDSGGEHELFLGDVGQELWEEVSIITAGGNYGWNVREGTHCFSTANPGNPEAITDCPEEDPDGNPLIDPIIEFPNSNHPDGGLGASIIGGVVYRGSRLPAWDGRYVFGQWSIGGGSPQGGLFVATRPEEGMWDFEAVDIVNREGGSLGEFLLAIGQDQEGEIYVLTSLTLGPGGNTGSVYRVVNP